MRFIRSENSSANAPSLRDRLLACWWRRGWRGFCTLQRLFPSREFGAELRYTTSFGSSFRLRPQSYIDGTVLREGFYESEVLAALATAANASEVVWDIGANFGIHATTLARCRPDLRIVAFEPNPVEHGRLLLHREWNAPQLITSAVALSDTSGVVKLHLGPEGNSGITTLTPWSQGNYTGEVLVAAITGDEMIATCQVPAPNIIKLDVEGHEGAVLRGLRRTLSGAACRVVVFEDGPERDTEPKLLLRASGFEIKPLLRNEHTAHALSNFVARKTHRA